MKTVFLMLFTLCFSLSTQASLITMNLSGTCEGNCDSVNAEVGDSYNARLEFDDSLLVANALVNIGASVTSFNFSIGDIDLNLADFYGFSLYVKYDDTLSTLLEYALFFGEGSNGATRGFLGVLQDYNGYNGVKVMTDGSCGNTTCTITTTYNGNGNRLDLTLPALTLATEIAEPSALYLMLLGLVFAFFRFSRFSSLKRNTSLTHCEAHSLFRPT